MEDEHYQSNAEDDSEICGKFTGSEKMQVAGKKVGRDLNKKRADEGGNHNVRIGDEMAVEFSITQKILRHNTGKGSEA